MKKLFVVLPCTALACMLAACNGGKKQSLETAKTPAIDLSAMDTTVRPGDDFYHFCNGNWIKSNPLKPEYSRYGSFDILRDSSEMRVHRIVEGLASENPKKGTNEYKVGLLYKQAMDSVARNKSGSTPIREELDAIKALQTKEDLVKYIALDHNRGGGLFFGTFVMADMKNSDMNILHMAQTHLTMGDQDYYLNSDMQKYREAYLVYLNKIGELAGFDSSAAKRIADNTLKVETALSKMCYTNVELRDSHKNYNMLEVKAFENANPGFAWRSYMTDRKLDTLSKFDVMQTGYFDRFSKWFSKADVAELRDYITAATIIDAASYLSDAFAEADFEFFGKTMSGIQEMKPRWKRAIGVVESVLGEPLGRIYVEKYFSPEAKERMLAMVKNLQHALSERISGLTWMSAATKEKAQEKLNNFKIKIGYPDRWRDFSKLEIKEDSYYANIRRATQFEHDFNMSELGKPVDKARWQMTPQTVNAYYNPPTNEICFPAGILQPPFFNMDADDAVNYGAIGVVIGHEMTHGFDDQGCNFDKNGNMINWWTPEDKMKFDGATARLVKQFDQIILAQDLHANGALTLGENIADQGGLLISYLAFQNATKGQKIEKIDGFTPDQRFYIGYARVWGQNIRPEEVIRLTKIDPHSLGQWRVDQTLRNINTFYKAFDVKSGDKMYLAPEDRVVVW